jgi:thiol-disulfide isomerase/thioredoxin
MTDQADAEVTARPARGRLVAAILAVAIVGSGGAYALTRQAPDRVSAADAPPARAPADDAVLTEGAWPEVAAYVTAQSHRDRPTVVKFFASWCEPCKAETPRVLAVARANPQVAFVGVAHEDRPEPARAFVADYGLAAMPTVLDALGETARAVGVLGMPGVAFFDADGVLVGTHIGPVTQDSLQRWLDGLTGAGPLPEQAA